MAQLVKYSSLDRIIRITINRPDTHNALNSAVVKELTSAFKKAASDKEARVVLFSGEGDTAFCSGADLRELHNASSTARKQFFTGIAKLVESIRFCPVPVIAKVHGFALAGGCGLAASADVVLASDESVFGLPEVHIGLMPLVVMVPIARSIGQKALADLMLCGDRISVSRAAELGLVTKVFSKRTLDHEALHYAASLARKSGIALRAGKRALSLVGEKEFKIELKQFAEQVGKLAASDDANEGMSAFLEKRKPHWQ